MRQQAVRTFCGVVPALADKNEWNSTDRCCQHIDAYFYGEWNDDVRGCSP